MTTSQGGDSLFCCGELLDHLSDAVLIIDAEGVIRYCNPSGGNLFGHAAEALAGRAVGDLLEGGCALIGGEETRTVSTAAIGKNGTAFRVVVTVHPCRDGQTQLIVQEPDAAWEREARYRAVVEDQTELIRRFRPDGTLTFVNPAFCRYFGLAEADLLGRNFITLFPPEDHEQVRESIASLTPERPVGTAVRRVIGPDGQERWQQWVNHAIYDPGGQLMEIQSVGRDITQQREMEQRLRESEARYRAVVEDQTELIRRFRPDGTLTFVNPAFCRYFHRSAAELLGTNFMELFPPEDHAEVRQSIFSLTPEQPVGVAQRRYVGPDGQERWQQWVNRAVFDEAGRLVEFQSVGRDITEQRQMERRLRESEARYRAVVEDQTDLIRRFTPDGRLTFVNPAFCRFHGTSEAQLLGRNYLDLVYAEDREMEQQQIAMLSPANPTTVTEPRVVRQSGELGWLQYVNRGIFDGEGRLVECQSVGRDITAQKEAEIRIAEAREATNRASRVTTLAIIGGGIAHEINQPLNAIRVLAETGLYLYELHGEPPAGEVIETLTNISRQVDRIDAIVNQLRSVLKHNQDRQYELCDLNQVVESALLLMEKQIRAHHIRLRRETARELPPVYGSFISFEEVVLNLLNNAMQALDGVDQPYKEIRLRTWAEDKVYLEVADNGPGFEPNARERILEPFFTTKSGASMGMGLSIVQSIVSASGGHLHLDDAPGGGALVRASFPIATQP